MVAVVFAMSSSWQFGLRLPAVVCRQQKAVPVWWGGGVVAWAVRSWGGVL
jgi:hypothetical protein